MDKGILKQYVSILKEISDEEKRINDEEKSIGMMIPREREVTDVVTKGKKGKKPLGICTIHGNKDNTIINRKRVSLRKRKAKKELHISNLENMVIDAEEYIYGLEESEIRRILLFFCIDRMSWREVAEAMGEGYTEDACKQAYSRFMRVK